MIFRSPSFAIVFRSPSLLSLSTQKETECEMRDSIELNRNRDGCEARAALSLSPSLDLSLPLSSLDLSALCPAL